MANRFELRQQSVADVTANENLESVDLSNFPTLAVQVVWTGVDGFAATLQPEVSIDGSNWLCPGTTDAILTLDSAADNDGWEWPSFPWRYIRMTYTSNSTTTGTITIYIYGKRTD